MSILANLYNHLKQKYISWRLQLCPGHGVPSYYDEDYGVRRCSITDTPIKYEIND